MKGKVSMPDIDDLKRAIMKEAIVWPMLCIWVYQNVSNYQGKLLMVWYEERHC